MHFPKVKVRQQQQHTNKRKGGIKKSIGCSSIIIIKGKRSIDKAVQTHNYYPKLKGIFQLLFFPRKKKKKKKLRMGTHKQKERESGGIDWISNEATQKKTHKKIFCFRKKNDHHKKRNDKSSSSPGVGQSEQNEAEKRREQKRQQDLSKQKSNRPK